MTTCASSLSQPKNYRRRKTKNQPLLGSSKTSDTVNKNSTCDIIDVTDLENVHDDRPEIVCDIYDLLEIYQALYYKSWHSPSDSPPSQKEEFVSTNGCSSFRVTSINISDHQFKHKHIKSEPIETCIPERCIEESIPKHLQKEKIDEIAGVDRLLKKSLSVKCERLDIDEFCRKNNYSKRDHNTVILKSHEGGKAPETKTNNGNLVCDPVKLKTPHTVKLLQSCDDLVNYSTDALHKVTIHENELNLCPNISKFSNLKNSSVSELVKNTSEISDLPLQSDEKPLGKLSISNLPINTVPSYNFTSPLNSDNTQRNRNQNKVAHIVQVKKEPDNSQDDENISNPSIIWSDESLCTSNVPQIVNLHDISSEQSNRILDSVLQLAFSQTDSNVESLNFVPSFKQNSETSLPPQPETSNSENYDVEKVPFSQNNTENTGYINSDEYDPEEKYVNVEDSESEDGNSVELNETRNVSDIRNDIVSLMLSAKPKKSSSSHIEKSSDNIVNNVPLSLEAVNYSGSWFSEQFDNLLFGKKDFDPNFTEEIKSADATMLNDSDEVDEVNSQTQCAASSPKAQDDKNEKVKHNKQGVCKKLEKKKDENETVPNNPKKITMKITRKSTGDDSSNLDGKGKKQHVTWTSETKVVDSMSQKSSISLASENDMKCPSVEKQQESVSQPIDELNFSRPENISDIQQVHSEDGAGTSDAVETKLFSVCKFSAPTAFSNSRKKCKTKTKKVFSNDSFRENNSHNFDSRSRRISKIKNTKKVKSKLKIESLISRNVSGSRLRSSHQYRSKSTAKSSVGKSASTELDKESLHNTIKEETFVMSESVEVGNKNSSNTEKSSDIPTVSQINSSPELLKDNVDMVETDGANEKDISDVSDSNMNRLDSARNEVCDNPTTSATPPSEILDEVVNESNENQHTVIKLDMEDGPIIQSPCLEVKKKAQLESVVTEKFFMGAEKEKLKELVDDGVEDKHISAHEKMDDTNKRLHSHVNEEIGSLKDEEASERSGEDNAVVDVLKDEHNDLTVESLCKDDLNAESEHDGSEKLFASSGESDLSASEDSFIGSSPKNIERDYNLKRNLDKEQKECMSVDGSKAQPNNESISSTSKLEIDSVELESINLPETTESKSLNENIDSSDKRQPQEKKSLKKKIKTQSSGDSTSIPTECIEANVRTPKTDHSNNGVKIKDGNIPSTSIKMESGSSEPVIKIEVEETATENNENLERVGKRRAKRKEFTDHVSFGLKRTNQKSDRASNNKAPAQSAPSVSTKTYEDNAVGIGKIKKEMNISPVFTTPSPSRGKKSIFDKNKTSIPFTEGWMREVVHRATINKNKNVKAVDVYYFTPQGGKLRSMPDVAKYLSEHKECELSLENFTFAKERIYREPFEKERGARPRIGDSTDSSPAQTSQSFVSEETPPAIKKGSRKSLPVSLKIKMSPPTKECHKNIFDSSSHKSTRKLKRNYKELDDGQESEDESVADTSKDKTNVSSVTSSEDHTEKVLNKSLENPLTPDVQTGLPVDATKTLSSDMSKTEPHSSKTSNDVNQLPKSEGTDSHQQTPVSSKSGRIRKIPSKLTSPKELVSEEKNPFKKKNNQETKCPPRKRPKVKISHKKVVVGTKSAVDPSTKQKR